MLEYYVLGHSFPMTLYTLSFAQKTTASVTVTGRCSAHTACPRCMLLDSLSPWSGAATPRSEKVSVRHPAGHTAAWSRSAMLVVQHQPDRDYQQMKASFSNGCGHRMLSAQSRPLSSWCRASSACRSRPSCVCMSTVGACIRWDIHEATSDANHSFTFYCPCNT